MPKIKLEHITKDRGQTEIQLRMSVSILQKRMKLLKRQKKAQRELRTKFQVYAQRRTFPREIIDIALSYIPTSQIDWNGRVG